MNLLHVENDGPLLRSSNFWGSESERAGFFYLSVNAGALRLLVPHSEEGQISEMIPAREVIVTRGNHRKLGREMVEVLFDDHTESPFAMYLSLEQLDRGFSDAGDLPRRFLIYRAGSHLAVEKVWYYREAPLPCLRPLV